MKKAPEPITFSIRMQGYSILEILFSLLVGGILLAMTTEITRSLFSLERIARESSEELIRFVRLQALFSRVMSDYDSIALPEMIRIHKDGIRHATGTLHSIHRSKSHPPSRADALSVATALPTAILSVSEVTETASIFHLRACPANGSPSLSLVDSFLGLNTDGVTYLVGAMNEDEGCFTGELHREENLFVSNDILTPPSFLIPLAREYTLYLNQNEELRFLGHRGNVIIENQPIMPEMKSLSIKLSPSPLEGIQVLSTEVSILNIPISLALSHSVPHHSYLNLLLGGL